MYEWVRTPSSMSPGAERSEWSCSVSPAAAVEQGEETSGGRSNTSNAERADAEVPRPPRGDVAKAAQGLGNAVSCIHQASADHPFERMQPELQPGGDAAVAAPATKRPHQAA